MCVLLWWAENDMLAGENLIFFLIIITYKRICILIKKTATAYVPKYTINMIFSFDPK